MFAFRNPNTKQFFRGYDRKGDIQWGEVPAMFVDNPDVLMKVAMKHSLHCCDVVAFNVAEGDAYRISGILVVSTATKERET